MCFYLYYVYFLCIYTASVIVCIITMNVPPTSEEYLSVVSGKKPQMDSSLCLLHEAISAGRGGSSLRSEGSM